MGFGGGACSKATSTRFNCEVVTSRNCVMKSVEQFESLGFIFVQRVALGHAAPADDLPQMIERHKMLAPKMVEGLKDDLLLDITHDLGAVFLDSRGIGFIGRLAQPLPHFLFGYSFLLRPIGERKRNIERAFDRFFQPGDIPGFGIGIAREYVCR